MSKFFEVLNLKKFNILLNLPTNFTRKLMHDSKLICSADMWDEKSKDYPEFEPNMKFENQILDFVEKNCFKFENKSVIDIGAGTGIYSINMALRGAKVSAFDISKNMLNKLENSAKIHNIQHIKTIHADFCTYETNDKFDILTCFMSPALNDEKVYEKLISLPKIGLCLLGWAGVRNSAVLQASFESCGEKIHAHHSFDKLRKFLNLKNIKFKSEFFENEWEKTATLQDFVKSQTWHLKMHGCTPNPKKIAKALEKFADKNGLITNKTYVRLELLTCVF